MVSKFLEKRYAKQLVDFAGADTVEYLEFDESTKDDLTGDVSESNAYPFPAIKLPAVIEFSPSKAVRERLGLEIRFDAVLYIPNEHVETAGITIKTGDAFKLPDDNNKYYIERIVRDMQSKNKFISYIIALSKKIGGR